MRYRLRGIYKRRGVVRPGRIRTAGDRLELCSLAFTPCGSVWCGSPSTIPITFSSWNTTVEQADFLRGPIMRFTEFSLLQILHNLHSW